jgi:hypothetical protein
MDAETPRGEPEVEHDVTQGHEARKRSTYGCPPDRSRVLKDRPNSPILARSRSRSRLISLERTSARLCEIAGRYERSGALRRLVTNR